MDLAKNLDGKLRNDTKQSISFKAIASVPNFELWLLLHYEEISAPLSRDVVLNKLKKYIPQYEKSSENLFTTTQPLLPKAMARAEQLSARFNAYNAPQPFTNVNELVKLLMSLRN